jgi:PAS domain S-box-containing protein
MAGIRASHHPLRMMQARAPDDGMAPCELPGRAVAMARPDGWSALFFSAFTRSRNAMVLVDDRRVHVEVNGAYLKLLGHDRAAVIGRPLYAFVEDGPRASAAEWAAALAIGRFEGEAVLIRADGRRIVVRWGADAAAVATGRRLVLFVVFADTRADVRRGTGASGRGPRSLTTRQTEIVRLVALGNTGPDIADELQIAHDTVRTHIRNAMENVGARSRAHLVAKAMGDGLVQP